MKTKTKGAAPAKKARVVKQKTGNNANVLAHQKKRPPMHSGRWTPEEEEYVVGLIAEFDDGQLPIAEGTTLRSFLAKMLNCNPKRVSKKYDGNPIYNGKAAYSRSKTTLPPPEACTRQENLLELERKFREALLTMQRVESRLQALTGQFTEQPQKKAPPKASAVPSVAHLKVDRSATATQSWKSDDSSVVSSLSGDEEAMDLGDDAKKAASRDSKPAARPAAGAEEEAASRMLLQLNPSNPVPPVAAASMPPPAVETPQTLLKSLYETHNNAASGSPAQAPPRAPVAAVAAASAPPQGMGFQAVLQKLNGMRGQQQLPPAPQPALQAQSSAPSNLQGFFALANSAPSSGGTPLRQPADTRTGLNELMQLVRQPEATPPNPNGVGAPAPANTATFQQQLQQPAAQQWGMQNAALQQALCPQQPQASQQNLEGLMQLVAANGSQPAVQQPGMLPPMVIQLNPAPQQQQQTNTIDLQAVLSNALAQAFSQQLMMQTQQQQQQPNFDAVLSGLFNHAAQAQQQQPAAMPQAPTNLLGMLQQSVSTSQQQPKPAQAPAAVAPTMDPESLQRLLGQLQQQVLNQGP
ncbi:expressed unknown protein [Seminavis robusta]|uniref:Uncharacterized protein n=1 Tax=Seminavis robusta TaxID=568900 RepID=A0A9N8HAY2_9STRA|nr:expressed unknown protein [Seminavis robusta]|eukprot:Sro163_g073320.1 n/a (580) ;mRNA; r:71920-73890